MKKKLNVMVVDDSPTVLAHVKFALERAGHLVTTRDSPLGTVAQLMKLRPDVLLLDVSMPALDGDRLAEIIMSVNDQVAIVLHSSCGEAELRRIAELTGVRGYISKTPEVTRFLEQFHRIVFGDPAAFRTVCK